MSLTRRDFLSRASAAALLSRRFGHIASPTLPAALPALDLYPHAGDPLLKELAATALEAARAAGSTYADVRFSLARFQYLHVPGVNMYRAFREEEHGAIGVRALADGAWGFAASPVWSADEAARLGKEAAAQARTNAKGRQQKIELGDPPPAVTGSWTAPVGRDPFTVSVFEKGEIIQSWLDAVTRLDFGSTVTVGYVTARYRRTDQTLATSDGTFVAQRRFSMQPYFHVLAVDNSNGHRAAMRTVDLLQPCAGGWEVILNPAIVDAIPAAAEEAVQMLDAVVVQPGRYDTVFDGYATAQLMGYTIGVATELDRALGYEANAGGTSYLMPPEEILGKYTYGTSLLNVTADRSRPGGLATVRWDNEGVVPDTYPVVREGVVVDYHTTRELASVLAPWYARQGRPHTSHGCSASESATSTSIAQPPNLAMQPGAADTSLEDLIAGLDDGLVVIGGGTNFKEIDPMARPAVTVDRQQLNGEVNGNCVYRVKKGRKVGYVRGVENLFRAPELWRSLQAIGGKSSQVWSGLALEKGQPQQEVLFSVSAVPIRCKQVVATDHMRKA